MRTGRASASTTPARPLDLDALFARHAPLVLEIGFGNGEQLLHAAIHEPARNFIGIEVHRPASAGS